MFWGFRYSTEISDSQKLYIIINIVIFSEVELEILRPSSSDVYLLTQTTSNPLFEET